MPKSKTSKSNTAEPETSLSAPPKDTARGLAADALAMVIYKKRPLDGFFDAHVAGLHPPDKAHAKALVWGALRRHGALTMLLSELMEHPLPDRARQATLLLLVGLTDLLVVGAAPHGAVDECVKLVKHRRECARYAGLVNAILRRITRDLEGYKQRLASHQRAGIPPWLAKSWQAYGWPVDDLADSLLEVPALDISLNKGVDKSPYITAGGANLDGSSIRFKAQDPRALPGFEAGDFWVQDAAAALPVKLMPLQPGERVLDLCAAPGGKTMQLAALDLDVVALDRSKNRLERVTENLERTGLTATIIAADGTQWQPDDGQLFDHILLDAPCTALGTFRRNPDILHIRKEADVDGVTRAQKSLLNHAITLLKPGGVLMYVVCSMQQAEGSGQIERLLDEQSDISLDPITPEEAAQHLGPRFLAKQAVTAKGCLLLRPDLMQASDDHAGGIDGFFIARLKKSPLVDG